MLAITPKRVELETSEDYATIRQALEFVGESWREQPSVEAIAAHAGLTPQALTTLFRRWCGLSPKAFLQAQTLDHARALVRDGANLLDASYELGLSGPGRLHDLFVTHESMSPGEWKQGGQGVLVRWGFHASPFGKALIMATDRGLCGTAFADPGEEAAALADMTWRWPRADFVEDPAGTEALARRIFDPAEWSADRPLRIVFIGSDFEIRVWETLLSVPLGRTTTYSSIAAAIEKPTASRAVGAAVGRNPMSFVVPCHRVLGKCGALRGYHWGLTRKRAMLGWEAARLDPQAAPETAPETAPGTAPETIPGAG